MNKGLIAILVVLYCTPLSASPDVYKCVENGITIYAAHPCSPDAEEMKLGDAGLISSPMKKPRLSSLKSTNSVRPRSNPLTEVTRDVADISVGKTSCDDDKRGVVFKAKLKNRNVNATAVFFFTAHFDFLVHGKWSEDWDIKKKKVRLKPGESYELELQSRPVPYAFKETQCRYVLSA